MTQPTTKTPRTGKVVLKNFTGEIENDSIAALIDFARQLEIELNEWRECAEAFYKAHTSGQFSRSSERFTQLHTKYPK